MVPTPTLTLTLGGKLQQEATEGEDAADKAKEESGSQFDEHGKKVEEPAPPAVVP